MIKITQIIRPPLIRVLFIWSIGTFVVLMLAAIFARMITESWQLSSTPGSSYVEIMLLVIVFSIIVLTSTMDWRRDKFSVIITTNGMGAQYIVKGFRAAFTTGHHMIDKADDMQPELMPRNWLQRLLREYYFIMGKDGKGFAFDPRLFSKEQLKIIDAKLQEFYGLAL